MHIPVMLNEVIKFLDIKTSGIYIDATFGCGGYTKKLLTFLGKNGRVLVMDKDFMAIEIAKRMFAGDNRVTICHTSFSCINDIVLKYKDFFNVDGIVVDLGLSSLQLDDYSRGFSCYNNGMLDMRMDKSQRLSACVWINKASLEELEMVLFEYGEKKFAKRVAYNIFFCRKLKPIIYTSELVDIVNRVCFGKNKKKFVIKVFQAIRMFINSEIKELEIFLIKTLNLLKIGSRLVIVSFNLCEDKVIKCFMKKLLSSNHKYGDFSVKFKVIIKYLRPSASEWDSNIKSRSAIMRVFERIK